MKDNYSLFLKRAGAIMLILAMLIAYFPILVDADSYAADEETSTGVISADDLKAEKEANGFGYYEGAYLTDEELYEAIAEEEDITGSFDETSDGEFTGYTDEDLLAMDAEDGYADSDAEAADPFTRSDIGYSQASYPQELTAKPLYAAELTASGTEEEPDAAAGEGEDSDSDLSANGLSSDSTLSIDENGIAYLNASTTGGVTFESLYIDDEEVYVARLYGQTYIYNGTFDMKDFDAGYHTAYLYLSDGTVYFWTHAMTPITDSPTIKLSDFYTTYSCITYSDNYNSYYNDDDCAVYLDYQKGSGDWSTGYGPVSSGESKQWTGMSSAKAYTIRAYYYKSGTYTYPTGYGGSISEAYEVSGPYSSTVTVKTAYKKTPIKYVKIKCRKQYSKKYRYKHIISSWWVGNVLWYKYRWKTKRIWYTKIKVTVRMKKKPGVAGIYIGTKKAKGNKKSYSKNFTLYGEKRGKKIKVDVQSYMSKTYGGWSKVTRKKVRVR